MSKKERKEYYKQFRNTWKVNPVTKTTKNNRKEMIENEKEKYNRETF